MAATRTRQGGGQPQGDVRRTGARRTARHREPPNGAARSDAAAPFGAPDFCETACVDPRTVRRAREATKPWAAVAALADTFKVLGDPTRLRIAFALSREELCVCDLAAVLGVSQSVVSHSLRALRHIGVVRYRRAGKIAYYALDDDHIAHLLDEGFRHVEDPRGPR